MKTPLARFCLAAALGVGAGFGTAVADTNSVIPVIEFREVSLTTAIETLGRQSGLNHILDPGIRDDRVSFRWEQMSAEAALARLLKEHNLHLVRNPATTVARVAVTNRVAHPADPVWIAADTNAPIPLIQMDSTPLHAALGEIARRGDLNVVLDPNLSAPSFVPGQKFVPLPSVSVRWQNLKPRQAIAALCENYELTLSVDATTGAARIAPAQRETPQVPEQPAKR